MIKPAQLQLVRQAWTGGFGGVWVLQKWGKQCCGLCDAVPRGDRRQQEIGGTGMKDAGGGGCSALPERRMRGERGHGKTALSCRVLLPLWEPQYCINAL